MHNLFAIINETDHIVRIELTNGKKYNPLSLDLIRDLTKTLKEISSQLKVKVLIIFLHCVPETLITESAAISFPVAKAKIVLFI